MDYSKVAKAKTYFEAVELLRPLIERFEKIDSVTKIDVTKFNDDRIWFSVWFESDLYDNDLNVTLRGLDDHNVYINKNGKTELFFRDSKGLDEFFEQLLSELSND